MKNKKENFWVNLGINIVIPALILLKAEKWLVSIGIIAESTIKPIWFFAVALSFPVVYGLYDLFKNRKWNIFSVFGIANVLLTGTIGIFELSRDWIIAKESGIPFILGIAVLASMFTSKPLAKILIYNDAILDTKKIDFLVRQKNANGSLAKTFNTATAMIAVSFFLSSIIQFFLASNIFTEGATGSEFNEQVGKMTWVAYLVVLVPCMFIMVAAIFKVFANLKRITGLDFENMLAAELREKA